MRRAGTRTHEDAALIQPPLAVGIHAGVLMKGSFLLSCSGILDWRGARGGWFIKSFVWPPTFTLGKIMLLGVDLALRPQVANVPDPVHAGFYQKGCRF